ncbi:MAG: acyl transferase, partial [Ferruginibacter sp.]|nr:acyl transferase [Cytophagales bacterium]
MKQAVSSLFSAGSSGRHAVAFEELAWEVFRYQSAHNPVYREYLRHLGQRTENLRSVAQIPFLPIELFKHHRVLTGNPATELVFESSGTTAGVRSRHYVADPDLYRGVSERTFRQRYGPLTDFHILALLPAYLERNNSSLVYMVAHFIRQSQSPSSGFFLRNTDDLVRTLRTLAERRDRKVLLIGVTFALLDLAESGRDWAFLRNLPELVVMETGGMKGRREELLREEVHAILTGAFPVEKIHSEYGMTEMLSQAYSTGDGIFAPPPTVRILLRDVNDPFAIDSGRRNGGINVIDLANVDSCAFVETKDLGCFAGPEGHFRVLGRFDNSD